MSNYLEILVEKMVADGVSEKDIKSVIEEVNSSKSPLHQDVSGTVAPLSDEDGVGVGSIDLSLPEKPTTTGTSTTTQPVVEDNEESKELTDEKCVEKFGEGYCEYQGQCYRCDAIPTDEDEQTEEVEDVEEDLFEEDDLEVEDIETEVEDVEEVDYMYDLEKSFEQNVIDIQEEINPETQNVYTAEEALEAIKIKQASTKVEEQTYNQNAEVIKRGESYNKATNVNNAQFVPENLENNIVFNDVADKMLEENGDFTLWKTDFTDQEGNEKVAVFPNAMGNNVLGEEGTGVTDGYYFSDKKKAWEHMSGNSNYLLFDSQEDADEFIKTTTGENGYDGFVAPWDYDAGGSIPSENIIIKPTKNKTNCPKGDIEKELRCIYFETNRVNKKKYPTFEEFYYDAIEEIEERKQWNPEEGLGAALPYMQWMAKYYPKMFKNVHTFGDAEHGTMRDYYDAYVLKKGGFASYNNAIDFNCGHIQDRFEHQANVMPKEREEIIGKKGFIVYSNVHPVSGKEAQGSYGILDGDSYRNILKKIDKRIWEENEDLWNEVHGYLFGSKNEEGTLPNLKKEGEINYDEEELIKWFYSVLNEHDYDGISYEGWDNAVAIHTSPYEYLLPYKELQAKYLVEEFESYYNMTMVNAKARWIDIDENGNIFETTASGEDMMKALEEGKHLVQIAKDINLLSGKINTSEEKLKPAVEQLNKEINDLVDKLTKELELFEIPGWEEASEGEKMILKLKTISQVTNESDRLTAIFLNERDKLIKKYEEDNKDLINKIKKNRSDLEKLQGDNAKKLLDDIRLYFSRIDAYNSSGVPQVMENLTNTFANLFGDNGTLVKLIDNHQKTYINQVDHLQGEKDERWENMGIFGDFLANTWLGGSAFQLFPTISQIGNSLSYDNESYAYRNKIKADGLLNTKPLNAEYGVVMQDYAIVEYKGVKYKVYISKGRLQGFYIIGDATNEKEYKPSTPQSNPDHAKAKQYIIEQLENPGSLDITTDFRWKGLASTVTAEGFKMYTIGRMTGGLGGLARGSYWVQGGFQGLAYGYQSYAQAKEEYIRANPLERNSGNAEKYALVMGVLTGVIAQINVEGRIGGKSFTDDMLKGIVNKWLTEGGVGMTKKALTKYFAGAIAKMIVGETVEEWAEALLGEYFQKTFDSWVHDGGLYIASDPGSGIKHNDIHVDLTGRDLLEMQIIITATSGFMGGIMAKGNLNAIKSGDVGTMYNNLAQLLKEDPTLSSLRQNLEMCKDGMTEDQYNNALAFLDTATSYWQDNINPKKFNYTPVEKTELLMAMVLRKDTETVIKQEEAKKKDKTEEDSTKLLELKTKEEALNSLIQDIEDGMYYSKGYGGLTLEANKELSVYLQSKFPGLDRSSIQEKINELLSLEKNPNFKETNPKEHKLLKEIRAKRKKIMAKMDKDLGERAKIMAEADGKDPFDKTVLNRYKQLIVLGEDAQLDEVKEQSKHNNQVAENPDAWVQLLQRPIDVVDKNTTNEQWENIIEACVTDRQRAVANSMRRKIMANPNLIANLYWSGGSKIIGQSGENSYKFNTQKNHLNGGRIIDNVIDINMEHARSNVAGHEASHNWFDNLEKTNPKAHAKMKETLIEYIKRNPNLIRYVRFGELYKEQVNKNGKIKVNTNGDPDVNGVLETDEQFQVRMDAKVTDEMIIEFLSDVIEGRANAVIPHTVKKGALNSLKNIFRSSTAVTNDIVNMDFDQIMGLVADICDGYSKGKLNFKGVVNANNLNVNGEKNNEHQSVNINGDRGYVVYDNNNNPVNVGSEINRLYKTDPEGAIDMSSKTFSKIKGLIDLVLENESKKSRVDKDGKIKGSFADTPGFDLDAFIMAAFYGSSNKSYEYIYQTMAKFDPLVNDDFFGFIMTKGSTVFLPQMLDGLKSGDVTSDMFYISTDQEQSNIINKWGPEGDYSDLSQVQQPGEDIDVNLIETEEVDFDEDVDTDTDISLVNGLDLDQEIVINKKIVKFRDVLDDIVFKIVGTKLPVFDEEVSSNRLKSHPFTNAIFQQAGDKAGRLRQAVQMLMGKGGESYKNFLIKNKGLLIETLTSTYLSKNIPSVVEKFVIGEGWTTDWQGKKIARYTKADGPAWDGVTSGPQKIRTVKLEEGQTWSDVISDEDFVAIYMTEKDGKYTRIQSKGEGLEYQISGEMGLETILNGLKDKTSDIYTRYSDITSHIHDVTLVENDIINIEQQMRRGSDKESMGNIIKITKDPSKYDGVFNNLINIGEAIVSLGNVRANEDQVIKVVEDILAPIIDPNNEGKPLFTPSERKKIAKDIFTLVEKYNSASQSLGGDVKLPMFVNKLLTNKALSSAFVEKFRIVDENNKPVVISESFDDYNKIMTQRHIPLQMVNEMITDGTMSKFDAVKFLLKHYRSQYATAGKISRGGQYVYDRETKKIKIVSKEKIKGNTQRYQVFNNLEDFVQNVVNEIDGVNVKTKFYYKTVDGVRSRVYQIESVTIDKIPIDDIKIYSPVTQTVKARRDSEYNENLEQALESRKALLLQLGWLAEKIKDPKSGYTKEDYIMLLMSLKSNMNTILRASANLKYDIGPSYKGKVRYEHMIPAEIVCQILADYHLNPKTKITPELLDKFFESYNVAIISTNMDDMLKTFELVSSMPLEWDPGANSIIRYYNDLTMGHKDIHPVINLEDNSIVGKEFVDVSNALDMDQIKSDANELKIKSNSDLTLNDIDVVNSKESIDVLNKKPFNPNTIRFFDFDETLTIKGKNIVYAISPDGKREEVSSEDFVQRAAELSEAGYTFDFSDFVNVRGGEDGPMLQKLRNQIERYGVKNIRILTARQPEAALAIFEWLKTKGINLPLENIKGLGVVDPETGKTKRITGVDKAIELESYIANGYVDIEMYDDSKDVVDAVNNLQDKYDIKIEGILAVENYQDAKESINVINSKFLEILKAKKGIDPDNLPTALQAEINASKKWTFSLFPPSSYAFRDFLYRFIPKGKEGEDALKWFDEMLTKPYNKGVSDWKSAKIKLAKRYKKLLKTLPKLKKNLSKNIPNSIFTYDNAVRVYIWDKYGYDIPGLEPQEKQEMLDAVNNDPELKAFADGLNTISLNEYVKPRVDWISGSIASDVGAIASESRAKYLTEWKENVELMFTEEIRNQLRFTYGNKFMSALDDMLYAMEYGTNRPVAENEITERFRNWVNNSVGAIMFLNMRSATLQTISMFNFIDWKNNNMVNAAKAFANQKQFWSDFRTLWNSDYVQTRLGEEGRGITEAEINNAIKGKGNKANALISYLLKLGFTPTKIADAFAICSGGSSFYRNQTKFYENQINKDTGELYTLEEAQTKAYVDFQTKAEESQQSSDPSQISQIQRSNLGILLLSFKNTPMQYARIMLRAADDIRNNRGNKFENLGKIGYYGMLQSALFVFLQQAVWAELGDEDEEEATDDMIQSMIDNILGGLGLTGQIIVTVKNGVMEYESQELKGWNADHTYTILQFLNLSPSIGNKFRKLYGAIKTRQINADVMAEMGLEPDNPAIDAVASLIAAFTNIPVDRAVRKVNNVILASSDEYEAYERIALLLGWNPWDLGLVTEKDAIRERLKKEKKSDKEKEKDKKKKEQVEKVLEPFIEKEIEQYEEDVENGVIKLDEEKYPTNKSYKCSGVNSKHVRCGAEVKKPGDKCQWHEDKDNDGVPDYKQESSKFKQQCEFIKTNGERCKNNSTGENGRCNVRQHQPGYKE